MIICILNIYKFEIYKGLLNIYIHLVLVNIVQGHNGCWDGTSLKLVKLVTIDLHRFSSYKCWSSDAFLWSDGRERKSQPKTQFT